jgi:YrbI family 3-deoxy-D-manno-octulosonate 8-phosphate phosphatase
MLIFNRKLRNRAKKIKFFFTDVDGTLTDGTIYYSENGELMKRFSFKDGAGFYLLKKMGITAGIITGENSMIVLRRAEKLGLKYCFLGVEDKLAYMRNFAISQKITLENIAYIGDDLNDMELLKNVGLSFCPIDANNVIRKNAHIICKKSGGDGSFRESVEILCNLINGNISDVFHK